MNFQTSGERAEKAGALRRTPLLYACSGCSDTGELADRVARTLSEWGVGEMSCLAGVGGRVQSLLQKAERAARIVVIDGCPLNCARRTLEQAGITGFEHVGLHQLGHRKGASPVTTASVQALAQRIRVLIETVARSAAPDDAAAKPGLQRPPQRPAPERK